MITSERTAQIAQALLKLDTWLESMRSPDGYGGPVAHWWRNSLLYGGRGLDWRYEGIISGYLQLWECSGDQRWLTKACRAGDDLVAGQLDNGHYPASCFEINPASAGTPHEAAADLGLLRLASVLRASGEPTWERYAQTAELNLQRYYLDQLWDAEARSFRDSPNVPSFVPNKAATACVALFQLAELQEDEAWVECYALPNLEGIIDHQVNGYGELDGAIAQNSIRGQRVEKYFPFYISRCVPALVAGYEWTQTDRFMEAAIRAMDFVQRCRRPDGSYPQVVYSGGRINRYPIWIAGLGGILNALEALNPYGFEADLEISIDWLLAGQNPNGAFRTGHGFASQVSQKTPEHLPELRDLLPVVGWNDKTFHFLAGLLPEGTPLSSRAEPIQPFETPCRLHGKQALYSEDAGRIKVVSNGTTHYIWEKGADWAQVTRPGKWLL